MHGSHHSDRMLSTGSAAYLHPDYLQPPNTSLDAKKSPLALLAQTCSSIGKDSSSSKSLIPPIDKKDSPKQDKSSSPAKCASSHSLAEADGENSDKLTAFEKPRCPVLTKGNVSPSRSLSKTNKESPTGASWDKANTEGVKGRAISASPTTRVDKDDLNVRTADDRETSIRKHSPTPDANATSDSNKCSDDYVTVSGSSKSGTSNNSPQHIERPDGLAGVMGAPPLGTYPPYPHLPYLPPHGLTQDLAASTSAYHSLLAAGKLGHTAPYLNYARVKTAAGASTLVPVCKDPYCSHCQVSMQSAQLHGSLPCPAGCAQCQDKSHLHTPTSLASAAAYSAALGGLSLLPSSLSSASHNSSALASLYSHGMAASMVPGSQAGLPFVCNWMSGGDYCGKRFTSSEELLQHLRSHTSASLEASAALALGLPYSGFGLSSMHPHLAPPAGTIGDAVALRQMYPRALSPTNALTANRYHPYKAALSSLASSPAAAAGLPSSSLVPPYISPFVPYGPARFSHTTVNP